MQGGNLQGGFDATQHSPDSGRDPLPVGDYKAMIEKSEVKTSKAGGTGVNITWVVVEGPYEGRKFFHWINLHVPSNADSTKWGIAEFSNLCYACGVLKPMDTAELENRTCIVELVIVVDEKYGKQNDVKKVKDGGFGIPHPETEPTVIVEGGPPATTTPPAEAAPAAPPAAAPPGAAGTPVEAPAQAQPTTEAAPAPAGQQAAPWS